MKFFALLFCMITSFRLCHSSDNELQDYANNPDAFEISQRNSESEPEDEQSTRTTLAHITELRNHTQIIKEERIFRARVATETCKTGKNLIIAGATILSLSQGVHLIVDEPSSYNFNFSIVIGSCIGCIVLASGFLQYNLAKLLLKNKEREEANPSRL